MPLLTANAKAATSLRHMAQALDEVFIVPAGPGDAAELARVHVRAWRETYQGLLPAAYLERMSVVTHARRFRAALMSASPREVLLVAEGAGGLVGYCGAAAAGEIGEIFTLYLVRRAQGRGFGGRMLVGAARGLAGLGARRLSVWVLEGNLRARAFYRHMGAGYAERRPARGFGGLIEVRYDWADLAALTASRV